jgi:transposase-like protein
MGKHKVPRTLIEAVSYFADQDVAHDFFVQLRWPNGAACPHCGNAIVAYMPNYRRWTCKECRLAKTSSGQFTAKTGTIFEDSPISFSKWLPAIWLLTATRNGTSSCELARALGVTQKTAWFMLHRIRETLAEDDGFALDGPVEADETYVGGLSKKMNAKRRARFSRSKSGQEKVAVFGMVERNMPGKPKGRARAFVVPFVEKEFIQGGLRKYVTPGDEIHTDGHPVYKTLKRDFMHHVIDHAYAYVQGHVHTNSIESFFSVFKRTIRGTYIAPRPKHLHRYVAEQVSRFNERESTDGYRFFLATKKADGKRLTYRQLTRNR